MARPGITYEEVAQAADTLVASARVGRDGNPTLDALRMQLGGTGSPNTIHAHLRTWKAKRPAPVPVVGEIPAGIVRAINDEIGRATAAVREELGARVEAAEKSAQDLERAGERLESDLSLLREQLASMTAERDRLAGQRDQQAADMAELQHQLQAERVAGEAARIELAQIRIKMAADAELLAVSRSDRERLMAELEQSRRQHVDVERSLAAATAAMTKMQERVDDLQGRNGSLEKERNSLQATLEAERTRSGKAERDLASSEARVVASQERILDLERREADLRRQLDGKPAKAQAGVGKRGPEEK